MHDLAVLFHSNPLLLNVIFLRNWRYDLVGNKLDEWPRPLISAIIHILCEVYSCALATEEEI